MMSIPKALKIAAAAGVTVGPVRKEGTVSTRAVGSLFVRWDSVKDGGAACWYVVDAEGVRAPGICHAYQGEAIARAISAHCKMTIGLPAGSILADGAPA